MNRFPRLVCSPRLWLTAVALWLPATQVLAQEGKRQPASSLKVEDTNKLQSWASPGSTQGPSGPDDDAILKRAAAWYVNRVTWSEYQKRELPDGTPTGGGITMAQIVQDAFDKIPVPKRDQALTDAQQQYLQAFTKALVPAIRTVLHNPEWIARVNAGRILARLGQAGQQGAGDLMVEVIQDPKQNDAVKLWALKGLKDLFAAGRPKPEQETPWIAALVGFVTQPRKVAANALPERAAALYYVRREGIRALAQTRLPSTGKAQTALVLLRIAANNGAKPAPSFAERLEAAVGVCQLQHKLDENYQPDYAANVLGLFLADFAGAYATDKENPVTVTKSDTEGGAGDKGTTYSRYAWKYEANRLSRALDAFQADAGGDKDPYVAAVVAKAKGILRAIMEDRATDVNRTDILTWVRQHPLPAGVTSVYKGDDKATVQPPESTEE